MAYAFFLGCIAPLRYPGIESATRVVFDKLGVEYRDIKGFSCCPAPGVTRSFSEETWLVVGARNLALAEKEGLDVVVICNGCYGSLFDVAHILNGDEEKRNKINAILKEEDGLAYTGKYKVKHFADVLYNEVGVDKIKQLCEAQQPYNVAIHYGCHFLKPSKHKKVDDPERPTILEDLVEAVGAVNIDYKEKQMCCGAGGGVRARNKDLSMKLTKTKLDNMKDANAEMIIDICPFCHLQFDIGQAELGEGYGMPVMHLSQLYGMAFGLPKDKLGIELHKTPVNL